MFYFVLQPLRERAIFAAIRMMEQQLPVASHQILHQQVAAKLVNELTKLANVTYVLVFAVVGGVFYFFLTRVIRPLRQAMEAQKRFVADASHELRTPLSIMKTDMEVVLMEENLSSQEARQTLRSNLSEIDRLSNIIQNMLDLSRVRDTSYSMPCCAVNLGQVVVNVVKMATRLANSKRINIRVAPLAAVVVWGNMSALEEVLINLVKNAVLYSPEGSRVNIWMEINISLRQVRVFVRDWGKGIAPQDMPHIFQPFFRGEKSRQFRAGGSFGLGLSIAQEIIERHNGFIGANSWLNKGTVIYFTLPLFEYQAVSRLPQLAPQALPKA